VARESIGLSLNALIPGEHLDAHREHMQGFVDSGERRRRMGEHMEIHGRRRDGSIFPAEIGIGGYAVDGKLHVTAVVRDITERVESTRELERQRNVLELIMRHVPDYIYFKDRESRFTLMYDAVAEGLEYESADEILGKTDFALFERETAEITFASEQELMRTGDIQLRMEERLISVRGGHRSLTS